MVALQAFLTAWLDGISGPKFTNLKIVLLQRNFQAKITTPLSCEEGKLRKVP
jgi:hypothetical protein